MCIRDRDIVIFRPENVAGSYAVYHDMKMSFHKSQERAEKYKVGKAFHIYRPKIIDSEGKWVWEGLNIDIEKGEIIITIPQDFLDNAVYPISSRGVEFGEKGEGDTEWMLAQIMPTAKKVWRAGLVATPESAGTLDNIKYYANTYPDDESIDTMAFVNEENSVESGSHGQIAVAEDKNKSYSTTPTWYTINFASEEISIVAYILNFIGDPLDFVGGSETLKFRYDSNSTPYYYEYKDGDTVYSDQQEDPWTDSGESGRLFSIYCTYTSSAVPSVPQRTLFQGSGKITTFGDRSPSLKIYNA